MKAKISKMIQKALVILAILVLSLVATRPAYAALLNQGEVTPSVTLPTDAEPTQPELTITSSPEQTSTPTPASTPTALDYLRPVIVVDTYSLAEGVVKPGERVNLAIKFYNAGQTTARNILIIFETGELAPLESGGVKAITQLAPGETASISQPLLASQGLSGLEGVVLTVQVTYADDHSITFTESFSLTFNVEAPVYYFVPTPTGTPESHANPQLMITAYRLDQAPLEAGMIFNLELDVINIGTRTAQDVTLILGGGSAEYAESGMAPSGIAGAGADFSSFAPYNSANLRYVGDLPAKDTLKLICPMIVNTAAKPGVHAFKISFAYFDEENTSYLDDQVITLLVHRIPRVEISFYRDPGFLQAGSPGILPVQVLNITEENLLVSSLVLAASQGTLTPSIVQVGMIEGSGYFTQDFTLVPDQSGDLALNFTLKYTDDFNQEQEIEQVIELRVEDAPEFETAPLAEETPSASPSAGEQGEKPGFLSVLWRLLLGLLGLEGGG